MSFNHVLHTVFHLQLYIVVTVVGKTMKFVLRVSSDDLA